MKTILIIEDSDDIRESTAEMLELAGYKTYTAANGRVGVELATQVEPDLILCDIMMPELDGYGVLYLLQKNTTLATTPFIFMTAKADRADMRKGMELGADDYLIKPFDEIELFRAIEARLRKRNAATAKKAMVSDNLVPETLLHHAKPRFYAAKQVVYVEKETPHYVFFIKSGKIKTYRHAPDGREFASKIYIENEFFGYSSHMENESYPDNAISLTDVELLLVRKADFQDHIYKYPQFANYLIDTLATNLNEKDNQLLKLAYFSVRKRVADALVGLAEKFGVTDDQCKLKISRDDLAAVVGTASETVSRTLADFKQEELIEKVGSTIKILSVSKLAVVKQ